MKKFKKLLIGFSIYAVFALLSPLYFMLMFSGGGNQNPVENQVVNTSATKIEEYESISQEIGVPFDLPILVNSYMSKDEISLVNVNPIFTFLEFCSLKVTIETSSETKDEKGNIISKVWTISQVNNFIGKKEILSYLKLSETSDIGLKDVLSAMDSISSSNSSDNTRTTMKLLASTDYKNILTKLGFNDTDNEQILTLHNENYIAKLCDIFVEVNNTGSTLPSVVEGDVTRINLIEVATSILNNPYSMGGKYFNKGLPPNALDCSGFVDWVYIQLFGKSVSSGSSIDGAGTAMQYYACEPVDEQNLQIGDLGFYQIPKEVDTYNHVGIYIGKINGQDAFIHCGGRYWGTDKSPTGRVVISINNSPGTMNNINPLGGTFENSAYPTQFKYFRRPQYKFND